MTRLASPNLGVQMSVETLNVLAQSYFLLSPIWLLCLGTTLAFSKHSKGLHQHVPPPELILPGSLVVFSTMLLPYIGYWLTSELAHTSVSLYIGTGLATLASVLGSTIPLWWLTHRPIRTMLIASELLTVVAVATMLIVYVRLAVPGSWTVMLDVITTLALLTMLFVAYVMIRVGKHDQRL